MTTSFQLFNEFPETGPRTLSQLLSISRVTTVWGPAYDNINSAYVSNKSRLSPDFFLNLLERDNSPVCVMAREEWLRDRSFRDRYASKEWSGARWHDGFDDRIRDILDDDLQKNLPPESRRVVVAGNDLGWQKAEQLLAEICQETKCKLEKIANDSSNLPPGIASRIERYKTDYNPIQTLVRDVCNHDTARIAAGARTAFLDSKYLHLVQRIRQTGLDFFQSHSDFFAPKEWMQAPQALEVLDRLQPLQTQDAFEEWFSDEKSSDRLQLVRLFEHPQEISIKEEILQRLLRVMGPLNQPIMDELFPDLKIGDAVLKVFSLGALAQAVWLLCSSGAAVTTGLLRIPLRGLARYGRRQNWSMYPATDKVDLATNNTAAVFQLVFGTRRPSERQFRAVVRALSREVEQAGGDT